MSEVDGTYLRQMRTSVRGDFRKKGLKLNFKNKNINLLLKTLSSLYHIPQNGPSAYFPDHERSYDVRITHDPFLGIYEKEAAHLLLKTFQIKGPVDIVSNFEDNSWGLDGYVSTSWRVI